jgi:hypothetical protein
VIGTFGQILRLCSSVVCDLGLDLSNTVYALDSTTIDLRLSLFEWASFRSTKAAVKMHTLLDLRGNIPTFIHVSDGKMAKNARRSKTVKVRRTCVNF